ncbi:hypothetical protein NC652_003190 [Populus alba x Populus x berolinensis]|uniref:Uncharacterized protein n=1 Tax=Populus alba x Populus x berolinensis TaxID=444605 RepID=A0AAD6WHZ5_9ROSI|nr:hypothetical protein NC652_003190 [Populus alba x Populus x berolinensis]KAJ7013535.1 hypothetical protein NC653_003255 [Populus alba x Populus x berolinensis]
MVILIKHCFRVIKAVINYLNQLGAKEFSNFIIECNLLEYPLIGHRYTGFTGQSKSHIDRAFATLDF